MLIDEQGLIYDASRQHPTGRIAFFTCLCRLVSGDWLCGFQVGTAKHSPDSTLRIYRSRDGGRHWGEPPARFETTLAGVPGSLSAPSLVEAEPGRLLLFATWFDRSDPIRPLFDPTTEGVLHSQQLLAESTDDGETWTAWQTLATPGLTGCATTGPVVRWSDGTLAYPFESFKEFDDPAPARHGAWIIVSRDCGRTFSAPLLVAQDPAHQVYYWDQRLCPAHQPGEFVALFWTHDRQQQQDRHVHLLRLSIGALDRRPTPQETSIPGQIAAPLWLEDGRLLAFVVDRDEPGTMTLWLSTDDGATWPTEERLVVHQHRELATLSQGRERINFAAYWEDMGKWSFGHPALQQLADGRLLLAWYAGTPDQMSIHWAHVRMG